MNPYRTIAILVGALFLTAMAARLVGGGLVESAIAAPHYLATIVKRWPVDTWVSGSLRPYSAALLSSGLWRS